MEGQFNFTMFPNSTSSEVDAAVVTMTSLVVKTMLYGILFLLSSAGNILIVIIVYKDQSFRSTVDIFIVNMAISDLMVPVFAIPKRIAELYMDSRWLIGGHFGSFLCKFFPFAENVANSVSVFSLVVIAIERFYSVVLPVQRPLITKVKRPWLIAMSWLIPVAGFAHLFLAWEIQLDRYGRHCRYIWSFHAWKVEFYFFFSFVIVLPFVLLTVLYSVIIVSMEIRKRKLQLADAQRKRREKRNRRIVFLLVSLVAVFILSWTPYSIFIFLYLFHPVVILYSDHYSRFYFAALFCSLSFTAINPCLYYIFNKNYRLGFKKCLSCIRPFCGLCGAAREQDHASDREATDKEMARNRATTIRFTDLGV